MILPDSFVTTNVMRSQCKFLDRLVVFERSKRQKLAAARALKDKQETAELTFMPKLIAKGPRRLDARRKSAQNTMTAGAKDVKQRRQVDAALC